MSSSNLKPAMKFPRCLVCSRILLLRDYLGRKKKVIHCPKCHIEYSRTAIKDADPERWERTRLRKLYDVRPDANGRLILFHQGLGSRRLG